MNAKDSHQDWAEPCRSPDDRDVRRMPPERPESARTTKRGPPQETRQVAFGFGQGVASHHFRSLRTGRAKWLGKGPIMRSKAARALKYLVPGTIRECYVCLVQRG